MNLKQKCIYPPSIRLLINMVIQLELQLNTQEFFQTMKFMGIMGIFGCDARLLMSFLISLRSRKLRADL